MASIRRRNGRFQVQVRQQGHPPQTATFSTLADAKSWAVETERRIERGLRLPEPASFEPLAGLLERFGVEVAPQLRSVKTVLGRLRTLATHLGRYAPTALNPATLAAYRTLRLKTHAPQTVAHELKLLARVLRWATAECGVVLPEGVPRVALPPLPRGRERVLAFDDEERLLAVATEPLRSLLIVAVETALRRGELLALRGDDLDLVRSLARIRPGKTGVGRTLPLTPRAREALRPWCAGSGLLFDIHPDTVTHQFARLCRRAGVEELRWHDLRHTAITRLSERGLDALEVAQISGHRDLAMLMRYSHLSAAKLAEKLRSG